MKVKELIEVLKSCDQEKEVLAYYDGDARTAIDCVFEMEVSSCNDKGEEFEHIALVLAARDDVYCSSSKKWIKGK